MHLSEQAQRLAKRAKRQLCDGGLLVWVANSGACKPNNRHTTGVVALWHCGTGRTHMMMMLVRTWPRAAIERRERTHARKHSRIHTRTWTCVNVLERTVHKYTCRYAHSEHSRVRIASDNNTLHTLPRETSQHPNQATTQQKTLRCERRPGLCGGPRPSIQIEREFISNEQI